jgi:cytochrome c oxidase cbb3-type subunit 1
MGNWSFWLITVGISVMGLVLTAGGLQQGYMWMDGAEWINSLVPVSPYWFIRTLAGLSMDIGMSLLVINLMMTALSGRVPVRAAERPIPDGAVAAGGLQ